MIYPLAFYKLLGIADSLSDPTPYDLLDVEPGKEDPQEISEALENRKRTLRQNLPGPQFMQVLEVYDRHLQTAAAILRDPAKRKELDRRLEAETHPPVPDQSKANRQALILAARQQLSEHMLPDGSINAEKRKDLGAALRRIGVEAEEIEETLSAIPDHLHRALQADVSTLEFFSDTASLSVKGGRLTIEDKKRLLLLAERLGIAEHAAAGMIGEHLGTSPAPPPSQMGRDQASRPAAKRGYLKWAVASAIVVVGFGVGIALWTSGHKPISLRAVQRDPAIDDFEVRVATPTEIDGKSISFDVGSSDRILKLPARILTGDGTPQIVLQPKEQGLLVLAKKDRRPEPYLLFACSFVGGDDGKRLVWDISLRAQKEQQELIRALVVEAVDYQHKVVYLCGQGRQAAPVQSIDLSVDGDTGELACDPAFFSYPWPRSLQVSFRPDANSDKTQKQYLTGPQSPVRIKRQVDGKDYAFQVGFKPYEDSSGFALTMEPYSTWRPSVSAGQAKQAKHELDLFLQPDTWNATQAGPTQEAYKPTEETVHDPRLQTEWDELEAARRKKEDLDNRKVYLEESAQGAGDSEAACLTRIKVIDAQIDVAKKRVTSAKVALSEMKTNRMKIDGAGYLKDKKNEFDEKLRAIDAAIAAQTDDLRAETRQIAALEVDRKAALGELRQIREAPKKAGDTLVEVEKARTVAEQEFGSKKLAYVAKYNALMQGDAASGNPEERERQEKLTARRAELEKKLAESRDDLHSEIQAAAAAIQSIGDIEILDVWELPVARLHVTAVEAKE